jgi:hypothetical protein
MNYWFNRVSSSEQWKMFLYISSSYKDSKSIAFVDGGVQKDLSSTHLLHHSTSSSCSLKNLCICLSRQELARYMRHDHSVLFKTTWASSHLMRIYRPQIHKQLMTLVTKFVNSTFVTLECHKNEPLYLI